MSDKMSKVVIIGCGIIGAAIAYELSQVSGLEITVIDQQQPGQAATAAALGVLMSNLSSKTKGKSWQLRQISLQRYETLIPELENLTKLKIPFNRHGILMLGCLEEELVSCERLVRIRHFQGLQLEFWDQTRVESQCPHLHLEQVITAVYSPQDRQVEPLALTQALIAAAKLHGVNFKFGVKVIDADYINETASSRRCQSIHTTEGSLQVDWLAIAAGNGSTPLTVALNQPVDIRPVLGQALHLRLPQPLGHPDFQPIITINDTYIVPLGQGDYWVGATLEFPDGKDDLVAVPAALTTLKERAISFCPGLAEATVISTWSGLRPRPEERGAPIIEYLPNYSNVVLATGHYRNGVLLAPATAIAVRQMISKN